jgi:hypothetical protein
MLFVFNSIYILFYNTNIVQNAYNKDDREFNGLGINGKCSFCTSASVSEQLTSMYTPTEGKCGESL